jgi:hypothetical protein
MNIQTIVRSIPSLQSVRSCTPLWASYVLFISSIPFISSIAFITSIPSIPSVHFSFQFVNFVFFSLCTLRVSGYYVLRKWWSGWRNSALPTSTSGKCVCGCWGICRNLTTTSGGCSWGICRNLTTTSGGCSWGICRNLMTT